ncbi:hypothetical protein Clacol_000430 [Clathrus columnatus]|uniref:Very-long-chain (3R)-3-hydroxyacyl-CoA dehydratase n=1 Tax=Clathrus columnatus TaxID=1419009 RepID=A0AAV4ZX52_9AGAM|nr:hypothetical protein Clacol_000430 [Clathrus columnatus]
MKLSTEKRHIAGLTPLAQVASATSTPTAASALIKRLGSYQIVKAILPFQAQVEASIPSEWLPFLERAKTAFTAVGWQVAVVQSFAILEVLHALLGWVRSPLTTTAMQVSSRLILVWAIADRFESARYNPIYTSMVFSWSITEIIRYTFYALNKLEFEPRWLLWLRYTTFYILYPTGAGSEAGLIYSTLPYRQAWANWSEGDLIRGLLFCIWWPGLYVMYTYMIKQRRKVLGKVRSEGQKIKTM